MALKVSPYAVGRDLGRGCMGAVPSFDLTELPAVSWNSLIIRLDARRLPGSSAQIDGWWCVMDGFVHTLALMSA